MKTTVGLQGNKEAYQKALEKYQYLDVYLHDFDTYEDFKRVQDKILFVITWEDSLSNLSFVMKHVKKKAPKVIAQKITPVIRKGRRDVYILSEDNLKFKEVYRSVLNELKEQYA